MEDNEEVMITTASKRYKKVNPLTFDPKIHEKIPVLQGQKERNRRMIQMMNKKPIDWLSLDGEGGGGY